MDIYIYIQVINQVSNRNWSFKSYENVSEFKKIW